MDFLLSLWAPVGNVLSKVISFLYYLFWSEKFITFTLPNGANIGIPLMALILIPAGIYFTIKTKCVLVRFFPQMLKIVTEKKATKDKSSISGLQALIVSTATRVGMGNLAGVVAAITTGGAGAVFWMWITALLGSATAFIEATLAQLHKERDPLYGGFRGGPAYYIHAFFKKGKSKKSIIAILFAISGLICWGGVSQVIGNSVTDYVGSVVTNRLSGSTFSSSVTAFFFEKFGLTVSFETVCTIFIAIMLVAVCAIIVLRKNATVKVLDIIVPIMAVIYFVITIIVLLMNITEIPAVFSRIFQEAFGLRQIAGGGLGAVIMMGAQRGLFSNEAGSGSAPCAAAAADTDNPVKAGLLQSLGVFIDTIIICSCTAFLILVAPGAEELSGMGLLQNAMQHHLGFAGVIFTVVTLVLFCISTFIGILFYARSNVAYLFGDNWTSQTLYKVFALIMLFVGCLAAYYSVWELADVGIALMTVFNMIVLIPMAKEPLKLLKNYKKK